MTYVKPSLPLLVFTLLALGGCTQPELDATEFRLEKPGASILTYPTERRGAYFLDDPSKAKYCAEPPPDVALNTLQEISASLKASVAGKGEGAADISGKVATDAIELAGRTQLVLLARELLYRLCELSINHAADSAAFEKTAALYTTVADVVGDFAAADRADAEAEKAARMKALKDAGVEIDKYFESQ